MGIMPIYEYSCGIHGIFEVKQGMHDIHTARCPKCGRVARRLFSVGGHYWDNPKPLFHKDGSYEEKY